MQLNSSRSPCCNISLLIVLRLRAGKENLFGIGELVSNLRPIELGKLAEFSPSAPLDRHPNNNNIIKLLPLDRDIPTKLASERELIIDCPSEYVFKRDVLERTSRMRNS